MANGKQGQYVITYDNSSGYYEWASLPQNTIEEAWEASGIKPGQTVAGYPIRLEMVTSSGVSVPV